MYIYNSQLDNSMVDHRQTRDKRTYSETGGYMFNCPVGICPGRGGGGYPNTT